MSELLVLGLGNLLCGDDGAGVAAVAELLRRFRFPEGVEVVDGGTLGLSLLPLLREARSVLLVDAVRADAPPGSIVKLEGEEVGRAASHRLSPHQVGVADLLDADRLLGGPRPSILLVGIVPERISLDFGLTPAVRDRLPALVEAVAEEAEKRGFPFQPLHADESEAERPGGGPAVLGALGL